MNTSILLQNAVKTAPDKIGLIYKGQRFSYAEIFSEVNKLTNVLAGLGCKKGDRVGILARNCPEELFLYYACARTGAVFTSFDYTERSESLISMINLVGPSFLFTDNYCIDTCISIHRSLPSVKCFVSLNKRHASYANYVQLMAKAKDTFFCEDTDAADPTAILFTSGATGKRKAVVFSHDNFLRHAYIANAKAEEDAFPHVSLNVTPFFHILGLQCIFSALCGLHPLVMMESFDVAECLKLIEREHISHIMLSPSQLSELVHSPFFKDLDLSSLKTVSYSGDLAHPSLIMDAIQAIPETALLRNLFGTTETTYDITILAEEDHDLNCPDFERTKKIVRLGSIGRPVENVEVIIADDEENPLPVGEIGEILVHTDRYMIGYLQEGSGKIEEFSSYWFHTSDLGYQDEDGYIFLVGHKIDSLLNRGDIYSPSLASDFIVYPSITPNEKYEFPESAQEIDFIKAAINRNTYIQFLKFLRHLYETQTPEEIADLYIKNILRFIPGSFFGVHLLPQQELSGMLPGKEEILKWDMPYFDEIPINAASSNIESEKEKLFQNPLVKDLSLQDYIEKLKPDHLICAPLFSPDRKLMGILSFGRVGTNWQFNRFEQSLIIQIANHFCIALNKANEVTHLKNQNQLLENIIMLMGIPVIVTDRFGQITYRNQYAHALLERELLGKDHSMLLSAVKENVGRILEEHTLVCEQVVTIHILNDAFKYYVKTFLSDPDSMIFVSTFSESSAGLDLSSLKNELSAQELSIAQKIAEGLGNQEIAEELHISVNTVKYHIKNLFKKMNVSGRTEFLTKIYALNQHNITKADL